MEEWIEDNDWNTLMETGRHGIEYLCIWYIYITVYVVYTNIYIYIYICIYTWHYIYTTCSDLFVILGACSVIKVVFNSLRPHVI